MPSFALDTLNIYVLLTLASWSIWGILDKKALDNAKYTDVVLRYSMWCVVSIPLIYLLLNFTQPNWHIHPSTWFWTSLGAVFSTVAIMCYMASMTKTEASYVLGITSAYPLILQFLAVPLLGEKLVVDRLLGAACIAAGVGAIGASPGGDAPFPTGKERWQLIALIVVCVITWGVWGIFDKKAIETATPLEAYFAERVWEIATLFVVFGWCRWRKIPIDLKNKPAWTYTFLNWAALAVGRYAYFGALLLASASYVITITGCYPLLMYFFAIVFLKEKFNKLRFVGIGLVVIGGILVQITRDVQ